MRQIGEAGSLGPHVDPKARSPLATGTPKLAAKRCLAMGYRIGRLSEAKSHPLIECEYLDHPVGTRFPARDHLNPSAPRQHYPWSAKQRPPSNPEH